MFFLFLACSASDDGALATPKGLDGTLLQGSPSAVGVVRLLNDDSTNLPVLDDLVALDRRAAKALMQHLADEGSFDDITEVDGTWWVGPAALTRLETYAGQNGFIPQGDENLGSWDGVSFTVQQAEYVLEYVNDADADELDAFLDRRAVDSIVAAGEIQTVYELSELYWVGNAALTDIKFVVVGDEEEAEAECELQIASVRNAAAADYTELLELTTMSDAPFADVNALSLSGCSDWQSDDEARAAVEEALWNEVFFLSYSEAGQYRDVRNVGSWTSGGSGYVGMVDLTRVVIDEHAEEGGWDPNDGGDAAMLYADVDAMFSEIRDPVEDNASDYVEVRLYMDMIECSEEAYGVVNVETGDVLVVHTFQRC